MPAIIICQKCGNAHWADRDCDYRPSEHDRMEAQYEAMKARQKEREHADAFMHGWMQAKLHSNTLEKAFEAWRVCVSPDVPRVDVMLRKLGQIRKLALSADGHTFDLILALVDEALPPTPDTRRMVETGTGSMRSTGSGLPEGSSKPSLPSPPESV